jgi:hypothetical protein
VVPQLEPWYCWKGTWQLVGDCGGPKRCGPKPPSTTSAITCLYDIRSPRHLHSHSHSTTAQLSPPVPPTTPHITYHLHASCLPIGCSPPRLPVHDQVITVKERRRVSYSRDRVRLASESSDTDKELSLSHRSMQIGSRTLQQTTSSSSRDLLMQPVVSSGLQQLAGMPLLNTELCSVTPRPIFCQFSSSSACISSVSETVVVFS